MLDHRSRQVADPVYDYRKDDWDRLHDAVEKLLGAFNDLLYVGRQVRADVLDELLQRRQGSLKNLRQDDRYLLAESGRES